MSPRIEVAELTSFRLKLPTRALEQLAARDGETPFLALTPEEGELVLSDREADSFLRFRPVGEDAILTDAALLNDARGRFFRVLGGMLIRHHGDLEARLVWSDEARNADGEWTRVTVREGATRHPALAVQRSQNQLSRAPAPEAVFAADGQGSASSGAARQADEDGEPTLPPGAEEEAREIARLLLRAEKDWAEYQRLKSSGRDSGR